MHFYLSDGQLNFQFKAHILLSEQLKLSFRKAEFACYLLDRPEVLKVHIELQSCACIIIVTNTAWHIFPSFRSRPWWSSLRVTSPARRVAKSAEATASPPSRLPSHGLPSSSHRRFYPSARCKYLLRFLVAMSREIQLCSCYDMIVSSLLKYILQCVSINGISDNRLIPANRIVLWKPIPTIY